MNRPRKPREDVERTRKQPSSKTRSREDHPEFERTVPAKRSPESEKKHDRVLNEDEQLKAVNYREDNAQTWIETSSSSPDTNQSDRPQENENERLEAGDDNSEVNPRPRKVN